MNESTVKSAINQKLSYGAKTFVLIISLFNLQIQLTSVVHHNTVEVLGQTSVKNEKKVSVFKNSWQPAKDCGKNFFF